MNGKKTSNQQSFHLETQLGRGASGSVYKGKLIRPIRDLKIGADIAVKTIHPELLNSKTVLARLKREVEIGIRVRSRYIVGIFGVEKYILHGQTTLAILMEYIDGESLKKWIKPNKQIDENRLVSIALQVARGLNTIHSMGIVHRDVKPANLMITPQNRVVLTDLGIARLSDISARITATGAFIGTCTYASPEQFMSTESPLSKSDMYSLGVVLYELATGINPFRKDNLVSTIQAHMTLKVNDPSSINKKLSTKMDMLIMNLLAKTPESRFSAQELCDFIEKTSTPDDTTQII